MKSKKSSRVSNFGLARLKKAANKELSVVCVLEYFVVSLLPSADFQSAPSTTYHLDTLVSHSIIIFHPQQQGVHFREKGTHDGG